MRVFCHMVVGPGEADRYLEPVLDRAGMWADFVHVTIDVRASEAEHGTVLHYADAWEASSLAWEDDESKFRQAAWEGLEATDIEIGDYVVCLDADEVIIDHAMVRPAIAEYPGMAIPLRFHEMWSYTHYRTDGYWQPYEAAIIFPYRPRGWFKSQPLACGREPTYQQKLFRSRAVGDLLHYGYARPEDRQAKHDRYMRLDGGRYHALSHLKSILDDRPSLTQWEKGGLLV